MEKLILFRTHLLAVFPPFIEGTGLAASTASLFVTTDANFFSSLQGDRIVREKTYCRIMARISALWPPGVDWPDGVPRPEPAEISDEDRSRLEALIEKRRAKIHPDWPKDVEWPSDIPKPVINHAV